MDGHGAMQALPLPSGRKRGCRGGKRTRGGHGNLHRVKEAQEARAARRAAVLEAVTADVLELFDTIVADGEIVEQQAGEAEGGEQGCTGAEARVAPALAPVPAPACPTAHDGGVAEQSEVDELGVGFVGMSDDALDLGAMEEYSDPRLTASSLFGKAGPSAMSTGMPADHAERADVGAQPVQIDGMPKSIARQRLGAIR